MCAPSPSNLVCTIVRTISFECAPDDLVRTLACTALVHTMAWPNLVHTMPFAPCARKGAAHRFPAQGVLKPRILQTHMYIIYIHYMSICAIASRII